MDISPEQTESVKRWLAEGADVAQVQTRLQSEFGINMRYIDVRFLIDVIGAQINDIPEPAAPQESRDEESSIAGQQVQVSMDPVPKPGAIASGAVIFSDGEKAEWFVDNSGRLGLSPEKEGYNAPQEDLPIFQKKLQELLESESGAPVENGEDGLNRRNENSSESSGNGSVEVSVSKIQRPDCIAFGDVTFSDGSKAEWRIDRMGQLGLVPAVEGQRPPQSDMPEFQRKLQDALKTLF